MSILYLVCVNQHAGIRDASERGWARIAMSRFATPAKDDVRVVSRFSEMVPAADRTRFIKGRDFPADPDEGSNAAQFAAYVAAGHAEWTEI